MTMRAHRKFRIFVRLSLIALLVEIGCLTSQANAALVAHWSFDTDFTDSTGGHNGTLVDGGTANSGIDTVDKKFGAGSVDISADGAPGIDYVDIASPVTLVHDADGFTFAFWVKKRNNDNQAMVLGDRTAASDYVWMHTASIFERSTIASNNFTQANWTSDTAWHHVAVVNNGASTNNMAIYLDGVSLPLVAGPTRLYAFKLNTIGDGWNGANNFDLNGNVDEVWVYDHTLTGAEIVGLRDNNAIPEPSTFHLLWLGLLGLSGIRRPGFPIWMYLKPLQARNLAYCNRMRPPRV